MSRPVNGAGGPTNVPAATMRASTIFVAGSVKRARRSHASGPPASCAFAATYPRAAAHARTASMADRRLRVVLPEPLHDFAEHIAYLLPSRRKVIGPRIRHHPRRLPVRGERLEEFASLVGGNALVAQSVQHQQ